MENLVLHYKPFRFSDDEFFDFCQQNENLKFERDEKGNIYIMSNTGGVTGNLNAEINYELTGWNRQFKLGKTFDSSTSFRLPTAAVRSANAAWVDIIRWDVLSQDQKSKFPPICPDFVIELMSSSVTLKEAKKKMLKDWMANGCKLGWLISPKNEVVYIYHHQKEIQIVSGFDKKLSGEDILKGFELDLSLLRQ